MWLIGVAPLDPGRTACQQPSALDSMQDGYAPRILHEADGEISEAIITDGRESADVDAGNVA